MYKYAQLKRFHRDRLLQAYMYDFMYVDPQKIPVEYYFTANTFFCCELQENFNSSTSPKTLDGI